MEQDVEEFGLMLAHMERVLEKQREDMAWDAKERARAEQRQKRLEQRRLMHRSDLWKRDLEARRKLGEGKLVGSYFREGEVVVERRHPKRLCVVMAVREKREGREAGAAARVSVALLDAATMDEMPTSLPWRSETNFEKEPVLDGMFQLLSRLAEEERTMGSCGRGMDVIDYVTRKGEASQEQRIQRLRDLMTFGVASSPNEEAAEATRRCMVSVDPTCLGLQLKSASSYPLGAAASSQEFEDAARECGLAHDEDLMLLARQYERWLYGKHEAYGFGEVASKDTAMECAALVMVVQ